MFLALSLVFASCGEASDAEEIATEDVPETGPMPDVGLAPDGGSTDASTGADDSGPILDLGTEDPAGPADGGAATFAERCATCHGMDGVPNAPLTPDLAGLAPSYSDEGMTELFSVGLTLMPPQPLRADDRVLLLEYLREEFGDYDPDAQRDGLAMFEGMCSTCHGDDGLGDGDRVPSLFEHVHEVDDERLVELITVGFREDGRGLRDAELPVFMDYLRARFGTR